MKTKLLFVFAFFIFQFADAKEVVFIDPVAPSVANLTYCDSNNDGFGVFDLTVQNTAILAAQSGAITEYIISYHDNLTSAQVGGGAFGNPSAYYNISSWSQMIYYRVRDVNTNAYAVGSFQLSINETPAIALLSPLRTCDNDADGMASIDLTIVTSAIMVGQSLPPSNYTVTFYNTLAAAEAGVGPIINAASYVGSNGQTIWYRVEVNSTHCYTVWSFELVVENGAFATGPQTYASCDNYGFENDGVALIDLTAYAPAILNGQDPAIFLLSYYTTLSDASAATNALTLTQAIAYVTDADADTIWVKVENSSGSLTPFCSAITTIDISVTRIPNPIINTVNNVNTICVDFITNQLLRPLTLDSGIFNPSAYTFMWRENGGIIAGANNSTYTVNTAAAGGATRGYTVEVTSNNALGCQTTSVAYSVIQSGPAVIPPGTNGYTITNLSGVQSITVNIIGYSYGEYEYSLDSGPRQSSNVFENVSLGSHTIHVWDTEGGLFYSCDPLVISDVEITTSEIPAPIGLVSQTFPAGSTLADIVVNGTDVQWYDSASNKNQLSNFSTPLPLNTVLVDGTTYYATQTVGGIESTAYLPVTVHLTLGIPDNEILPIQFAPNPVRNNLTLQSAVVIKSVNVYTIIGQKVFEQNYHDTNISIDLSWLPTGNYILKAQGETGEKTIRIVKE